MSNTQRHSVELAKAASRCIQCFNKELVQPLSATMMSRNPSHLQRLTVPAWSCVPSGAPIACSSCTQTEIHGSRKSCFLLSLHKFNDYICGKQIQIKTYHQPLVTIPHILNNTVVSTADLYMEEMETKALGFFQRVTRSHWYRYVDATLVWIKTLHQTC